MICYYRWRWQWRWHYQHALSGFPWSRHLVLGRLGPTRHQGQTSSAVPFVKTWLKVIFVGSSSIIVCPCHSLTNWLMMLRLDWHDPSLWRCQLETCWSCYYCWFWWWGRVGNSLVEIFTLKIVQDIEAVVWSWFWIWSSVEILKLEFVQDFWSWNLV